MTPADLWRFLPIGYLITVLIETPILIVGLSPRHSLSRKLLCGYPIVVLVLPLVLAGSSRGIYIAVAETFAPVSECALFWAAFGSRPELGRRSMWRDFGAIVVANLASFLIGELITPYL